MDFLKEVFGEKALTYAELEALLKANDKIKLANLASGDYVSKGKFTELETDRNGLKTQLEEANKAIEGFKGLDVDGIKKAADEWKAKAEQAEMDKKKELDGLRFEFAISSALTAKKARNVKAVKALLDVGGLVLNGDKIVGLDEQLENIKKEDAFLFDDEEDGGKPNFAKGGTGGKPNEKKMSLSEAMAYKNAHPDFDISKLI